MAENKDRIADDAVEYWLFPVVDISLGQETKRKILLEHNDAFLAFVSSTLVEHIWQKEQFNLIAVTDHESLPPHLYGKTCYGDNIEDEWLIVNLLFNLTKQYDGLVAKIRDSDEEFMLIEAADYLPKWLEPDAAENRIYIYQGNVHIIPIPQSPAQITTLPSGVPEVQYAVKCVRNYNTATIASPEINTAVKQRFEGLSEKIRTEIHHAHCYIPANLAIVLDIKPSLISAGVNAFYYRDPLDLKACRTMRNFRPGTRVMSRVKFTRCLYAQLVQQEFKPDRRSGFQMPSTSNPKYLSHDLGMKLAHGFEILCSKCSSRHDQKSNGGRLEDNVRWQRYLKSLIKHGYFKDELEGSRLYKHLLDKAKQFFMEQMDFTNRTDGSSNQGEEVLDILDRITVDIEQLREAEHHLEPPDDDSWLQISPEDLDKLMFRSSGLDPTRMANSEDISDVNKLGDGMKAFVNKVSGVGGAEFPGEDDEIQFDGTGFITQMQKMFEFNDDDDASSSDMSEYGWDDSDDDVDDQPPISKSGKKGKGTTQPSVKDYMDMMDRELATTEVGKSFERVGGEKEVPKSNVKVNGEQKKKSKKIEEEDVEFRPVDINMTVVKNMLQSLESQQGLAGPASNILGSMGIKAPAPMAEEDCELTTSSSTPEAGQRKKSGPTIPPRPKPTDLPVAPPRNRRSPKKSSDSKPPLVVRQESNV